MSIGMFACMIAMRRRGRALEQISDSPAWAAPILAWP